MTTEDLDMQIREGKERIEKLKELVSIKGEVRRLEAMAFCKHLPNSAKETASAIAEHVCEFYQVPITILSASSREERFVIPRHAAIFLIREHTKASLEQIGSIFHRNHTAIVHAHRSTRNRMDTDKRFRSQVEQIEASLNGSLHGQPEI